MKKALISVSDKNGLEELARALVKADYEILGTSGTAAFLKRAGISVIEISDYTGFTETSDGRVKTLHTKLYTDILGRPADIQIVVVNLYPFEEKMAEGLSLPRMIEFIDIGGVTLLRGAAKNFEYVTVVSSPDQYPELIRELESADEISGGMRERFARAAFQRTAIYDAAVTSYLSEPASEGIATTPWAVGLYAVEPIELKYGENPHQNGRYYRFPIAEFQFSELLDHPLSYNNLMDLEAAILTVGEFENPAVAVMKHANPCGVAEQNDDKDYSKTFTRAYNADSKSAWGGVIALNRPLTQEIVAFLKGKFVEVLAAPEIPESLMSLFAKKKKLRLVQYSGKMPAKTIRSTLGGVLVQDRDYHMERPDSWKVVTNRSPTDEEKQVLLFAWKVTKHTRSNSVVITGKDVSLGIGGGLPNRVDSATRALNLAAEQDYDGVRACASDGLFPFADSIKTLKGSGVTAVIQPGGAMRDEEVIAAADELDIAMVFTGVRHFAHW
ncbi:bifunctional phosphoribosylaminoimidazolecarboxamide formyltransferase/IMP cyclohydrolase [candidate division WOR-3 bacterium]|uniref:Bifunctional purine biosynthesis protein PurH n=1 Tax=candidate division WOR-3 bacterium TaxID=2052148 RepID=A0A9D5K9B4_UNCW3|nr:bifunctional phosphoribosylaminoimidazolecarboxamide formyltransferase/IMP cyclohydrolase [candidate division WOR-3 bacterium]MBD3364509.1 bifunctional phosphoribosylaminoimidazolecarboxamide formyltransferase/IMP cyclohydrolase [candidate division WOR-3 bacterium]